jgi:hypothetical protein|tara:strand:+ start:5293 stop:5598 length:306 start_codon:yes stop_codon:yes gene_type:complete
MYKRYADSTSKFEEQIIKEIDLMKFPLNQRKRAPLWIERARGHTSICRICTEKIKKGSIRFGTHSPNPYGWQPYFWHPDCYTSQILKEWNYAEEIGEKKDD